ncbi:MAG: hypothetical protein KDB98_13210 [Flavobacteriales bacterium]|nr:hypothetical protein [Flavobacteriales bacterium]
MDRLFELIGKMSQTEKAHFRKFGFKSISGGEPERKLFEIILKAQQKKPTDPEPLVKLNYAQLGRTDLVRMRARLFDALLNSISDHDRQKHDVYEFSQLLLNSRTLASRGLHREAKKLLRKGAKLASDQQKPHWELLFGKELNAGEVSHGSHSSILSSIDAQLDALDRTKQLTLLAKYYEMAFHIQRSFGQQREERKELEDQLREIEFKADELDLEECPPSASFNRIMIRQVVAHTLNETESALKHTEAAFQLMKQHAEMARGREQVPIALLSNLINDGLSAGRFEYYQTYKDELKFWSASIPSVKNYRNAQVFRTQANAALYFGEFEKWSELLQSAETLREHLSPHVREAISGQIVHMMFADGAYRKCIRLINDLLFETKALQREDLRTNLELLLLSTHFELKNMETVEQLVSSLTQRQKSQQQFTDQESVFIHLFKKLPYATTDSEQNQLFRDARETLQRFKDSRPLGFFNPTVWISAKATRQPYEALLKQHYGIGIRQ